MGSKSSSYSGGDGGWRNESGCNCDDAKKKLR